MAELRLSDVKNDLKKIGCKLKSQLDGSWAICEAKGARIIVPTLEAVQDYYSSKTSPVASFSPVEAPAIIVAKPLTAVEPVVKPVAARPVLAKSEQPVSTGVVAAEPPKAAISEEQKLAIAAVNQMLKEMKEDRLKCGLNFLHSEIKPHLLKNGCPETLVSKAHSYAEARLQKDCLDKNLARLTFRNHLAQNDVMYFDNQYAHLISKSSQSSQSETA